MEKASYFIVLPVPEEVDGAVSSPLQHGPASVVEAVFAPGLDQPVAAVWLQQVHPTGGVSCLAHLITVPERPCGFRKLFLFWGVFCIAYLKSRNTKSLFPVLKLIYHCYLPTIICLVSTAARVAQATNICESHHHYAQIQANRISHRGLDFR